MKSNILSIITLLFLVSGIVQTNNYMNNDDLHTPSYEKLITSKDEDVLDANNLSQFSCLFSSSLAVSNESDNGAGSLRQAIADAAAGDSIIIPEGFSIVLQSSIVINKNLIINGQGATITVANPGITSHKLLEIGTADDSEETRSHVELYNITLYPGDVSNTHTTASNVANCGPGLTLYNYNTLSAYNVSIHGGKGNYAGAVFMAGHDCIMLLQNCNFENNQATSSSGGAVIVKGEGLIDSCRFENNVSAGNGSTISAYNKTVVSNSIFRNNEAQGSTGGAIVNYAQTNGNVEVSNCLFDGNVCSYASSGGGAIAVNHNHSATIISNSTFTNNSGFYAGAISFVTNSTKTTPGKLTLVNNTFTGNSTSGSKGGAVYINNTKSADYTFTAMLVNNIFAFNYNNTGIQDLVAENTGYYTLEGSNNIFGNSTGIEACTNTIDFYYDPETELFEEYTTTENKKPVLNESGVFQLSGINSAAYQTGVRFGIYNPEIIPATDQNGLPRAMHPCVGASEYADPDIYSLADINHIIGYGQSLSLGSVDKCVISQFQKYNSMMFSQELRTYDYTTSDFDNVTFVPLVEKIWEGHTNYAETPLSGISEMLIETIAKENGAFSKQLFFHAPGKGGTSITGLNKGNDGTYGYIIKGVERASQLAENNNKSYKVPCFTFIHGEADTYDFMDPEVYKNHLIQLQQDINADVKAITGQEEEILCLLTQVASFNRYWMLHSGANSGKDPNPEIALAQLQLALEQPEKFVLATTMYPIIYGLDNVHLTAESSKLVGAYFGYTIKKAIIDGMNMLPIHPLEYAGNGNQLTVKFHVPGKPLVLDTKQVRFIDNYGFNIYRGDREIDIESVEISGEDEVIITCSEPVQAGDAITYAINGKTSGALNGARGNLRDSRGEEVSFMINCTTYKLHNWCPIFKEEIVFK